MAQAFTNGGVKATVPEYKVIVSGEGLTIQKIGEEKPPQYASNQYREVE